MPLEGYVYVLLSTGHTSAVPWELDREGRIIYLAPQIYVDANFASPYALVAFVSLLEKGLTFDIETVDLAARANQGLDFARTSITRRVPTLVHDGFFLSESSAICEYIDETFPGTRLYPKDPRDRARARQVQAWVRSDLAMMLQRLIVLGDPVPQALIDTGSRRCQG